MFGISKESVAFLFVCVVLCGCSMGEEMRRIEESKAASKMRDASRSTNLTGEQLFVRSCNTCHPGAKAGMGPSLETMNADFPTDDKLKKFLRTGKGLMPAQPVADINDEELSNLVAYLRSLSFEFK